MSSVARDTRSAAINLTLTNQVWQRVNQAQADTGIPSHAGTLAYLVFKGLRLHEMENQALEALARKEVA